MKVSRYKLVCGLTLLELVLVMVIICTILATAAPSLRGFFTSRETSDAAAQIVALTHLARSQAITEGRVYRLNLDVENKTYWLTVQEQGGFRRLYNDFGQVFTLPKDTVVELDDIFKHGASGYIDFTAQGQTQAGTIRLINRRGEVFEIVCLSPSELYQVMVPEKI